MTEIINHKKESPLLGLLGVGGGPTGLGLAGGITPDGQELFGTAGGTFSWLCPSGVTSVSVVCIGGGGGGGGCAFTTYTGGGGGACAYKNNISVSPGTSYTVVVGTGGANGLSGATDGGDSYFINASTVMAKGGESAGDSGRDGGQASACVGDAAYNGGDGGDSQDVGAGGQGSSSNGANGSGHDGGAGGNGGGGGGGKGASGHSENNIGHGGGGSINGSYIGAGGGGGGSQSAGGSYGRGGGGGGGGNLGTVTGTSALDGDDAANHAIGVGGPGGRWGGGGGSGTNYNSWSGYSDYGGVRIIWSTSGTTRAFPGNNVGDVS
jgi:hypothetical protein